MILYSSTHKFALKVLQLIFSKSLLRKFLHWKYSLKTSFKTIHKKNSQESLRVGPSPTKRSLESSPSHVSIRLFNQAQEIENHKNEIRKSLIPEYSFTPKLSNGTKKWLDSKIRKDFKPPDEEIAVVSGKKILSFTNFGADLAFPHYKMNPPKNPKSRIFTSRNDRKSDIVSGLYTKNEKNSRIMSRSNSKC